MQDTPRRLEPWFEFATIGLGMERAALYDRVDDRVDRMMDAGFLDEVERLIAMGYDPACLQCLESAIMNWQSTCSKAQTCPTRSREPSSGRTATLGSNPIGSRRDDPRICWFEPTQLTQPSEYVPSG